MATIHLHANIKATPEQFVAGLTDFGPGRGEVFGNSADKDLVVHEQGVDHADVTEGSRGVWERLTYDWSDPRHVVLTTTDSNVWSSKSSHVYDLTPLADGTTDVDYTAVRDGKNLGGRIFAVLITTVGKGVLVKAFQNSVHAIEGRS
ncbi:hypothetical protein [Kribbella sp. NPDC004536]|uniref:hypothetical protein n=1 Tax=Kribbella sp. NPDC004536 TaxID=3364106 RepID=UPI0036AAA92F